jgi:hypothetical protein
MAALALTTHLCALARRLCAGLVVLLCATSVLAQDGAPADWAGEWETEWRDGGSRLILEQDGANVTGSYPLFDGRVEATAEGRVLRGQWFGTHSLDVDIFSYILASDMDGYTAIREDLLLRIMATVEVAGTQFAFPSVTHYAATDKGLEADKIARAEAAVEEWRASDGLPFPDFEWQSKAELSGSLDYPPEGSVLRREGSTD